MLSLLPLISKGKISAGVHSNSYTVHILWYVPSECLPNTFTFFFFLNCERNLPLQMVPITLLPALGLTVRNVRCKMQDAGNYPWIVKVEKKKKQKKEKSATWDKAVLLRSQSLFHCTSNLFLRQFWVRKKSRNEVTIFHILFCQCNLTPFWTGYVTLFLFTL